MKKMATTAEEATLMMEAQFLVDLWRSNLNMEEIKIAARKQGTSNTEYLEDREVNALWVWANASPSFNTLYHQFYFSRLNRYECGRIIEEMCAMLEKYLGLVE